MKKGRKLRPLNAMHSASIALVTYILTNLITEVKTIKKLMETKEKVTATFSRGDACDT